MRILSGQLGHCIESIFTKLNTRMCGGRIQYVNDTHPVVADERGKIGRLEAVDGVEELGTVDGVRGGENTAWEEAHLQQGCDGRVFGGFCNTRITHSQTFNSMLESWAISCVILRITEEEKRILTGDKPVVLLGLQAMHDHLDVLLLSLLLLHQFVLESCASFLLFLLFAGRLWERIGTQRLQVKHRGLSGLTWSLLSSMAAI